MKIRLTLPLFAALFTAACIASASRPNIVFIITDDQRWDGLSINGHPAIQTPNIDRIGHEGLTLDNFLVSTPLCSPSRATFLTGRYPRKHNIINNDKLGLDVISHTLMTFPRQLREAGYETGFVGKWHMGLDDSRRPGFDTWISFKGQGIYIDGVINHNGDRRQLRGYMTDYINTWAVEFLEQPRDRPFCLYVSHKAVHAPFLPALRHNELYADFAPELPAVNADDLAGKPMLDRNIKRPPMYTHEGVAPEPPEPHRNRDRSPGGIIRDQMRSLAAVDEGVGQLYATLERLGELDNTIFIYTSDNGFLLGEHGKFNTKRWAYDPNLRVPFLVRYPPLVKPGTRSTALVGAVDVAPTLLELSGVESVLEMQGRSFTDVLADPTQPGRQELLAEYFYEKVTPEAPAWQAIRTSRWKFIQYESFDANLGSDELYDLATDPAEITNLINSPDHQEQQAILKARLQALIAQAR